MSQGNIVRIDAYVPWHVARDPDSGRWIGVCPALRINVLGDTWKEFQNYANEAVEGLFGDLYEDGELEAFLDARGWLLWSELPGPGLVPRFDVPFVIEQHEIADILTAIA